jgi:hypothetical protein
MSLAGAPRLFGDPHFALGHAVVHCVHERLGSSLRGSACDERAVTGATSVIRGSAAKTPPDLDRLDAHCCCSGRRRGIQAKMPGTASVSEIAIHARVDAADAVDEHDRVGRACVGRRAAVPTFSATSTVTSGSCSGTVSCDSTPVRSRDPRIDGELHASSRSTWAARSVRRTR